MSSVKAIIKSESFLTVIENNTGNTVIADEPIDLGGQGKGFTPTELLASSLAACTSITLRMYANRKQWKLDSVEVNVSMIDDKPPLIRSLRLLGELTEEQRLRLLEIANHCPVHKILTNTISIQTDLLS